MVKGLKRATQGLLESIFDPETVEQMKDRMADDAFQLVEPITPEFRCPRCAYEWRGNPMPRSGAGVDDDADSDRGAGDGA